MPNGWGGIQCLWTGPDGTVWDLTSPSPPVLLAREGVRGMGKPPADLLSSTSPGLPGSRYRGRRVKDRPVFWPILVQTDEAANRQGRLEVHRAWWASLDSDRPGWWSVIQPDGTLRRLLCRFVDDADVTYDHDPTASDVTPYGVNLVADDEPFWQGEPVTTAVPRSYVTIPNPGDVQAWPVWLVPGPRTVEFTVVTSYQYITVLPPVAAGAGVLIDTRPGHRGVWNVTLDGNGDRVGPLGTERTDNTTNLHFAPIPAGGSATVFMQSSDTTPAPARLTLTPMYERAW